MAERTEFVGRTTAEWRSIREAVEHWYGFSLNESQHETEGIDDALDLIEEIDRRFDSQR